MPTEGNTTMTTPPRCRYCGKPIAKQTRSVNMTTPESLEQYAYQRQLSAFQRWIAKPKDEWPRTKADCQRLSNWTVVSVSRDHRWDKARDEVDKSFIGSWSEWDGESYADRYFCSGDHAKAFGYRCAEQGMATQAYHDATKETESA